MNLYRCTCRYLTVWVLFIVLLLPAGLSASEYNFNHFSIEHGLSQSRVQCIFRDHLGVVWIGTKRGLNSFDQSELKNYYYDPDNGNSIPGNYIRFITEGADHMIYVSTNNGVARYDRREKRFERLMLDDGSPLQAWSVLTTDEGFVFGGEETLYKYNIDDGRISRIFEEVNGDRHKLFNCLYECSPGIYVASSHWNGIWFFDTHRQKMYPCPFVTSRNVNTIYIDSLERLWVSVYGRGVDCYTLDGKYLFSLTTRNSELSNDIVFDFLERDHEIWLATDGGGINILDMRTSKISQLRHNAYDPSSLPDNSIYCLYKDAKNNIWGGCVRKGLFCVRKTYVKQYDEALNSVHYGIGSSTVISLYEDRDSLLWCGTDGGGLLSYDFRTDKFMHCASTSDMKVVSIAEYDNDHLLLSAFNSGLYLFDKRNGRLKLFKEVMRYLPGEEFSSGDLVNVHATSERVYIMASELYVYNRATGRTETVDRSGIDINRTNALQLVDCDRNSIYFMGVRDLFRLDCSTNRLELLVGGDELTEFLSACRDNNGNFWIGSDAGLLRLNRQSGRLEKVETSLFSHVSSLICDDKGRLWIGAQNMLFSYIIDENRFVILDKSDGMYPNELIFTPVRNFHTHNIYMGGTKGLVRINTDIVFNETHHPKLRLLDISLNGKSALKSVHDGKIVIPHDHSSLNIRVITDEMSVFRKHLFRYEISGEKQMVVENYNRQLELGMLSSGDYTIRISCDTESGEWTEPITLLDVEVMPPVWKRSWFIALAMLLLSGVGLMANRMVMRKKEERLNMLHREHEKKIYEDKISFLINFGHELSTPLTLIYATLKRILNGEVSGEQLSEYVGSAFRQVVQMKDIVNIILDVRRMETGNEVLHIARHSLNEWIVEVLTSFDIAFKANQMKVEWELDEQVGIVAFDDMKCRVVLSNLLMNALKYTPAHGCITVGTRLKVESVMVYVRDTGVGLDGVEVSRLFTRFYKGGNKEGSSGIGLSYAKMLVDLHHGTIGALNNEAEGATFYFELPLTSEECDLSCPQHAYLNELSQPVVQEHHPLPLYSLEEYSLLVVEDNRELRQFMKEGLASKFKKIYLAKDGDEALETIRVCNPDIVVSDVMMPGMDGFSLCRKIKEDASMNHIPVILLTARDDADSQVEGYAAGADGYLAKPFDFEMLLSIVCSQLKNRERVKSRYRGEEVSHLASAVSNADEEFMKRLNEVIDRHLSMSHLDVKLLTDEMAMSRTSLYNKMKLLTGMGAKDYINHRRIEHAGELLLTTDMTVTEISEHVGFAYQRYFSTLFKEMMGCSPSQYRAQGGRHSSAVSETR